MQLIKQPLSILFLNESLFESLNNELWNILIKIIVNKYLNQIYDFWLQNLDILIMNQQLGVLKELCIKYCNKYGSQTSLYIPFMFASFAFNTKTLKKCILSDKKLDICTYAEGIEYVHIFENYTTFLLTMSNCIISKITKSTMTITNEEQIKESNKSKSSQKIANEYIKPVKNYKKITIPIVVRRKVWAKHVGEDIGKTKCHCCGLNNITQLCFSVGHIIPESKGGTLNVNNLLPICVHCNSSCGTNNLVDFISYCKGISTL